MTAHSALVLLTMVALALVVTGVALINVPAALILTGALLFRIALSLDTHQGESK